MSNGVEFIALAAVADNARKIKRLEAEAFVKGFSHDSASTADRTRYAESIKLLYPTKKAHIHDRVAVGVIAAILLLGGISGYFVEESSGQKAMGIVGGLLVTIIGLIILGAFGAVTDFVFNKDWLTITVVVIVICFELVVVGKMLNIPEKFWAWREGPICYYTIGNDPFMYSEKCK